MKLLLILILIITQSSFALEWESGNKRVHLLELFTSESCSSCPPTEKWLNTLKDNDRVFKDFVPVEFHVDYWNYLDWEDRFSKPEYTHRQRSYASARGSNRIFTPQLLMNSTEDRRYIQGVPARSKEKTVNLKANFNKEKNQLSLKIESSQKEKYICELALLGGSYKTKVKGGENEGKSLEHEFVVLDLLQQNSSQNECLFKIEKQKSLKNKAIAVWIKKKNDFKVIQATGSFLE